MAYFGFTDKLRAGKTIQTFNYGNYKNDFTYIDDIVTGMEKVMGKVPDRATGEDGFAVSPPQDYNFEAHKELVPMQLGDVPVTYADTSALERDFGFKPSADLRTGLRKFAEWYKEFYM